jgi:hypothetical protein
MRRCARLLGIHRETVARKLRFLASEARIDLERQLNQREGVPEVEFDELETFEHSKYKPLSVVLAVIPGSRKILGFEVAVMPPKGPLVKTALRRYGVRPDHRPRALHSLFRRLQPVLRERCVLRSDQNPRYPRYVRRYFPRARHQTVEGQRGSLIGSGELKRVRWDPLFSLNHTFAMFRANVCRLIRKTWCTTKKAQALADHLAIYAAVHNTMLTPLE